MFERYTEKARRVIFFARYEASQFGSPYIETEHILLGLLREDKSLSNRFLRAAGSVESIRKQIEEHTTFGETISTSVDLPLSNESKRVLAYAAEEAERLGHRHIGTEHLMLGLLREENSFAAKILRERGLELAAVRAEMQQFAADGPRLAGSETRSHLQRLSTSADLAPESMRVLMHAAGEADLASSPQILPEHLLIGLLREEKSRAGQVLREVGLSLEAVRERFKRAGNAG